MITEYHFINVFLTQKYICSNLWQKKTSQKDANRKIMLLIINDMSIKNIY